MLKNSSELILDELSSGGLLDLLSASPSLNKKRKQSGGIVNSGEKIILTDDVLSDLSQLSKKRKV